MFLDNQKVFTYFKNRYILRKASNGWHPFDCPFCLDGEMKAKHAVSFEYEFTKCWVCGYRGSIIDFVMESECLEYFQAKALLDEQEPSGVDLELLDGFMDKSRNVSEVTLPYGYKGIMEGTGVMALRARTYLTKRNFDLAVMDRLGFGYCDEKNTADPDNDYFGYIIVPFKKKGKLQYYLGRDYIGNWQRYKNPPNETYGVGKADVLFNADALDICKRVFVLEGWSDASTIGKEGVSTQGWSLSPAQKSMILKANNVKELVFVADKGFYGKAVNTAMQFLDSKPVVKVVSFEDQPGSSDENKDVNAIGLDRFKLLYEKTPPLTFEMGLNIII